MTKSALNVIASNAKQCTLCENHLIDGLHPVFQVGHTAKILIAGQAPGSKVHLSGIPFDDKSGERLRHWMGINKATFYNPDKIAILPMGFCYPGRGKSGDLPPRPECAPQWRQQFLDHMPNIQLTLVIGSYAQQWHIKDRLQKNLTETVRQWEIYWPTLLPLPHPSPRNNIWLKKNEWFERDVVPQMRERIKGLI
jgi:uracil-DNA glycosylase|tara:strand:- start:270 stop:854 length:585 start_codon:yes stop_codon:yes gene_type:complete